LSAALGRFFRAIAFLSSLKNLWNPHEQGFSGSFPMFKIRQLLGEGSHRDISHKMTPLSQAVQAALGVR
jgi:hypothetical protein